MAESKNAKNAKKAAEAAVVTEESTPQASARAEKKKSRWTAETCMRAAKRFMSRDEWAHGAPSSFKAAVAKGWDHSCCQHMTIKGAAPKMVKPAAAKPVKTKTAKAPAKKSRSA